MNGAPDKLSHRFIVENECQGWRLDRFLNKKIPRLSRTRVQRVIGGECWVDGRVAKKGQVVAAGQTVTFLRPAPTEPEVPRVLPVLHSADSFYALDKPAGIAMHPTAKWHHSTVTAVLRELFPGEALQITHRLDLETSGVLLIARSREASIYLKRCFAKRLVHKRYLAIVHGTLSGEGLIDAPLGLDGGSVRIKMAVRAEGLPSRTRWRTVEQLPAHTLVECWPETGRQHQIRAHLDHLGHPVVGDKMYPDGTVFADYQDHGWDAVADRLALPRHALHAAELTFPHPTLPNTRETVHSPLPADLRAFLDANR